MGILYTFYSYKGGVGRSMALANVAALLSRWGHSVLAIDWDLEAPGLEKYFMKEPSLVVGSRKEKPGIVDLVTAFENGRPINWEECLLQVYPFGRDGSRLEILSAGQDSRDYVPKLQSIDWRRLFNDKGFGAYLEELRDEWLIKYDFVLVDSRTGITDIGGVCTIHLPDVLVVLFTANEQSLYGVIDVVERANAQYHKLPDEYERPPKLLCVPVPSRFEYFTEYQSATSWLKTFAERLKPIYAEWPSSVTPEVVLEKLFIPNIPFWSFGEGLPVAQEGTSNPRSLGFAYELLAKVLKHRLQWNDAMRGEDPIKEDSPPEVINQAAERAFNTLNAADAELASRLLRRLVFVAPDAKRDARKRVALSDFDDKEQGVVKALAEARLLSVTQEDGEEIVEIARDSTLRHWERLKKWLDADREFLVWRQKLGANISEWKQSNHDHAHLLTGSALETALKFSTGRMEELTPDERGYILGSNTEQVLIQEGARRRRIGSVVGVILLLIVGGILLFYAYKVQERNKAQLAFTQAELSTSRGMEKFAAGDNLGAIQDYEEALRNKNDYDLAYLNRGEAYLNLANANPNTLESERYRKLAVSDFERAVLVTTNADTRLTATQFAQEARNPISPRLDPYPDVSPIPSPDKTQSPSPSSSPSPTSSSQPSPVLTLAPRVYIQSLDDADSRKQVGNLQVTLSRLGYTVMRPSIVKDVPQMTEVRYYRKSDAKEAGELSANLPWKSQLKYLVGFENSPRVRPRHFEIWVGAPRGKGQQAP